MFDHKLHRSIELAVLIRPTNFSNRANDKTDLLSCRDDCGCTLCSLSFGMDYVPLADDSTSYDLCKMVDHMGSAYGM